MLNWLQRANDRNTNHHTEFTGLEGLEERMLLSASQVGDLLIIYGDINDNEIVVAAGANPGELTVQSAPGVADNTGFAGVDRLIIRSRGGDDTITVLGSPTDTGSGDMSILILASWGDDIINGSDVAEEVRAGDGDDTINGGGGNDRLWGEAGNDTINGGDGNDVIYGHQGLDVIDGGDGNDVIYGNEGSDIIDGGNGNDTIFAKAGNDTVIGGAGDDEIRGGFGSDNINAGYGDDTVLGQSGNDVIRGGQGVDIISGGLGNDLLLGGPDNDTIRGNQGYDSINGGLGDDLLRGGPGNDGVIGGGGNDNILPGESAPATPAAGSTTNYSESENNGFRSRADRFHLFTGTSSRLIGTSYGKHDKDFFVFTARADGTVTVNVQSMTGAAVLEVEDIFNNALFETNPGNGVNSGSFNVVEGRTYFVRLRAIGNSASQYRVKLTM